MMVMTTTMMVMSFFKRYFPFDNGRGREFAGRRDLSIHRNIRSVSIKASASTGSTCQHNPRSQKKLYKKWPSITCPGRKRKNVLPPLRPLRRVIVRKEDGTTQLAQMDRPGIHAVVKPAGG